MTNPLQHSPAGEPPPGLGIAGAGAYDKSALLFRYAAEHGCRALVETGLYYGTGSGMPVYLAGRVERYIAIDYQQENLDLARSRMGAGRIDLLLGDSGVVLADLLAGQLDVAPLESPALFWLDAHAITEEEPAPSLCPVVAELQAVACWGGAGVVLIDDYRLFGVAPGWPSQPELLEECRRLFSPDRVEIDGDSVVCRL